MRRKKSAIRTGTKPNVMMEYIMLLLGSLLIALSFNMLLNPNQVASGGVSGISTMVNYLTGIEPAYTQWALNIPLFIMGLLLLGKRFGMKTVVGSIVLPLFVLVTRGLPALTNNTLLASIYGGIGIGAGLGIVFRGHGSTGGLDVAAQILHKYTGLSLGVAVAVLDALVIFTAGIVFTPEKALYALIGLFVTSKTIDIVQIGFRFSRVAFIVSEKTDEISHTILNDLDRGLTKLSGYGGYTGKVRPVLMVVVSQREVTRLKTLVQQVDPKAFVIISDTAEVLGEGFKVEG